MAAEHSLHNKSNYLSFNASNSRNCTTLCNLNHWCLNKDVWCCQQNFYPVSYCVTDVNKPTTESILAVHWTFVNWLIEIPTQAKAAEREHWSQKLNNSALSVSSLFLNGLSHNPLLTPMWNPDWGSSRVVPWLLGVLKACTHTLMQCCAGAQILIARRQSFKKATNILTIFSLFKWNV